MSDSCILLLFRCQSADMTGAGWIRFEAEARQLSAVSRELGDEWQMRTFEASFRSEGFEF